MNFSRRIYTVDINKLLRWLVPVKLRQSKTLSLIKAFASPLQYVYAAFLNFKSSIEYELTITPQYCYIQRALNDTFDTSLRRIMVKKGDFKAPVVLYTRAEAKPVVLYKKSENKPVVFYKKSETAAFTGDFIVQVPAAVNFNEARMRALVNKYCLPDKIFTINVV